MSNRKSSPRPKPGDLIEIFRAGYQHWAIYVGGGDVIHLTLGWSSNSSCHVLSGSEPNAVIKRQPLLEVAGNDDYRINNSSDKKWKPLPVDQIIKNAEAKVGGTIKYKVTTANCEHFVSELRYGEKVSFQGWNFGCADRIGRRAVPVCAVGGAALNVLNIALGVGATTVGGAVVSGLLAATGGAAVAVVGLLVGTAVNQYKLRHQ